MVAASRFLWLKPERNGASQNDQVQPHIAMSKPVKNIDERKAEVRVLVTKGATLFAFLGGSILIAALLLMDKVQEAVNVFSILLPVASGVIAYWFAARGRSQSTLPKGGKTEKDTSG